MVIWVQERMVIEKRRDGSGVQRDGLLTAI